jgi:AI-2 transport protein TqsA
MDNNLPKEPSLTVLKIAALIIIIAGIVYAKSIILPFLLALFISIICAQPIYWLEKKKVPKSLAIFFILIGILAIFLGFGYLVGGAITSFSSNAPKYEASLKEISDTFIHSLNDHGIKIADDQFTKLFEPSSIINFAVQAVNELVKITGNFFLIFIIILFMFLELNSIPDKVRAIFKGTAESLGYLTKIITSIRHYLGIKTIIAIVTSVLIFTALSIIGVEYAILWALMAGLASFIPHIGSTIAAIPALLFALVQLGSGGAIWTLVSFLVINNTIGNFFEPRIMGKGLGLSALVVFLSLIFWGFILGTIGMFLSVPLTITIKIILEQNEDTRWIAILLGTAEDVKIHLENKDKETQINNDLNII